MPTVTDTVTSLDFALLRDGLTELRSANTGVVIDMPEGVVASDVVVEVSAPTHKFVKSTGSYWNSWITTLGVQGRSEQLVLAFESSQRDVPSPVVLYPDGQFLGIVALRFADGSLMTGQQLLANLQVPAVGVYDTSDKPWWGTLPQLAVGGADAQTMTLPAFANNVVSPGQGNDSLILTDGGSTTKVSFKRGDGHDTIAAAAGLTETSYVLQLGRGIGPADLRFLPAGQGVLIGSEGDQISGVLPSTIVFSDGVTWDAATIRDTINLQTPPTLLLGTAGNDTLSQAVGNVVIRGDAGADSLTGGTGADTLEGGDDADTLNGGLGVDLLVGGKGADRLEISTKDRVSYRRGDGTDDIIFSGNNIGRSGDYELTLEGLLPQDLTVGGKNDGSDLPQQFILLPDGEQLKLTDLPSAIFFDDGTVWRSNEILALQLKGSPLNDVIQGIRSGALAQGQDGDDQLTAFWGATLEGGRGNDTLSTSGYPDLTQATTVRYQQGDGRDQLFLSGTNTIQLGAGIRAADVVVSQSGSRYMIRFNGSVSDSLQVSLFQPSSPVVSSLSLAFADGTLWSMTDLLARSEGNAYLTAVVPDASLVGGAGNDWLEVSLPGNGSSLSGGQGDDVLLAVAGKDSLVGGLGNDTLIGGLGNDLLDGGAGADLYFYARGDGADTLEVDSQDTITLGAGIAKSDVVIGKLDAASNTVVLQVKGATGASVDSLTLLDAGQWDGLKLNLGSEVIITGAQIMALATQPEDLTLTGTAGSDNLDGKDGNDTLSGRAGNDTLKGGAGTDWLTGGKGSDVLDGGAGADTYAYSRGDGPDTLLADGQDTVVFDLGIRQADLLVGKLGASAANTVDVLIRNGSTSTADMLTLANASSLAGLQLKFADGSSLTGAEILAIATKPDSLTLTGTTKADKLTGKDGNDTLSGLAGNDTLAGGKGNDSLIGGKGNDTYLFNRGDGQDVIVDTDSTLFNSDLLKLGGATSKQLWLTKSGSNLNIQILGTQDKVTVQNWFAGSANQVEKITASDGKSLSASKVNALVNAMASFTPPADAASLPANTPATVTKLVASSWV
jgi:Ca2+-binding RTX toxin-like protein